MSASMMRIAQIDDAAAVPVGPGCVRRDLPSGPGFRSWIVELAPGSEWPHDDVHDTGEAYLVLSGEVIERDLRFSAGTYVVFDRNSVHRPRSAIGARLFGFNPVEAAQ